MGKVLIVKAWGPEYGSPEPTQDAVVYVFTLAFLCEKGGRDRRSLQAHGTLAYGRDSDQ